MEEVRENWMQLMRDVGKLYERAEQELHIADADLKKVIAQKQVEAEAQHGCKTAVSQQRFADNDEDGSYGPTIITEHQLVIEGQRRSI